MVDCGRGEAADLGRGEGAGQRVVAERANGRGVEAIDLGRGQRGEGRRRKAAERGRVQAVELAGGQRVDLG